jgi:hypothetical protein
MDAQLVAIRRVYLPLATRYSDQKLLLNQQPKAGTRKEGVSATMCRYIYTGSHIFAQKHLMRKMDQQLKDCSPEVRWSNRQSMDVVMRVWREVNSPLGGGMVGEHTKVECEGECIKMINGWVNGRWKIS